MTYDRKPGCARGPITSASFLFSFSLAFAIASCNRQTQSTSPAGTPSAPPEASTAQAAPPPINPIAAFELPSGVPDDPAPVAECVRAESRVRAGYALEEDFWQAVHCIVVRMAAESPADAQVFVDSANEYHRTAHDRAFMEVYPRLLVEPVSTDFQASDLSPGKPVRVYAVDSNVRRELSREATVKLGAGAYRGVCFPWQKTRGHYEVSHRAATRLRVGGKPAFSVKAADLLADASQDPDIFAWESMAAHAQTPHTGEGLGTDPALAQRAFLDFVHEHVGKASEACAQANTRHGLYWLGYALHAVEDLAPHRGRTNTEHAYNAYVEKNNPDERAESIALAEDLASLFLQRVLAGKLAGCVVAFRTFQGGGVLLPEKLNTIGLVIDGTPKALWDYRASKDLFAGVRTDPRAKVRWFEAAKTCTAASGCAAFFGRLKL